VKVEARLERLAAIVGVSPSGHRDQMDRRQERIGAKSPGDFVAVHAAGKPDVAEQHVGPVLLRSRDSVPPEVHDARVVAQQLEERPERPGDVDVVLDDEYVERPGGSGLFCAHIPV
jgi:hypothetical protein